MLRDLRQLLQDTAVSPSTAVSASELVRRGRRLRRMRQGAGVGLLAAVALLGVLVVPRLEPRPDSDVIFQPPTPSATEATEGRTEAETGDGDHGPRLVLNGPQSHRITRWRLAPGEAGELPRLPDHGVAVAMGERVVLLDMSGEARGHMPGRFYVSGLDRRRQAPTHLLLIWYGNRAGLPFWLDPSTGNHVGAYHVEGPLWAATKVAYIAHAPEEESWQLDRGREEGVFRWPSFAGWWVSPDHRLVTWLPCTDGDCAPRFYDSDMVGDGELPLGCWAAHALGDFSLTLICDDGRSLNVPDGGGGWVSVDVPEAQGEATRAKAVFDTGIVRVDTPSCRAAEPFRITGETLKPLRGLSDNGYSAIPLGVLPDGRVVLHYNSDALCGRAAPSPGVYVLDPETGQQTQVWEGAAAIHEVRMWAPTGDALD